MRRSPARSAFVVVPLVAFLVVTLIALGVALGVKASKKPLPRGVGSNSAYGKGRVAGATYGPALAAAGLGLVLLGAASKIEERKGRGAANVIVGGILLLAHLPYGMNLMGVAKPSPVRTAGGGGSGGERSTARAAPVIQPVAPAAPERDAEPRPAPSPRETRTPTRTAVPSADDTPREDPSDAASEVVVQEFQGALETKIEDTLGTVELFLKEIARPPAHTAPALRDRAAGAAKARDLLSLLEASLKGARNELEAALVGAGVGERDAASRANGWAREFKMMPRAFGVGRVIDLVDRAAEESRVLEEHFTAWRLEKGEITTKDASLRGTLTSQRFFIGTGLRRLESVLDAVRGK